MIEFGLFSAIFENYLSPPCPYQQREVCSFRPGKFRFYMTAFYFFCALKILITNLALDTSRNQGATTAALWHPQKEQFLPSTCLFVYTHTHSQAARHSHPKRVMGVVPWTSEWSPFRLAGVWIWSVVWFGLGFSGVLVEWVFLFPKEQKERFSYILSFKC